MTPYCQTTLEKTPSNLRARVGVWVVVLAVALGLSSANLPQSGLYHYGDAPGVAPLSDPLQHGLSLRETGFGGTVETRKYGALKVGASGSDRTDDTVCSVQRDTPQTSTLPFLARDCFLYRIHYFSAFNARAPPHRLV